MDSVVPPPLKILQVERLIAKQTVQIVRQICKENIFFAERKLKGEGQRQLENTLRRDELSCVDVRIWGKFCCVVDSAKYDWNGVQSEISWS